MYRCVQRGPLRAGALSQRSAVASLERERASPMQHALVQTHAEALRIHLPRRKSIQGMCLWGSRERRFVCRGDNEKARQRLMRIWVMGSREAGDKDIILIASLSGL